MNSSAKEQNFMSANRSSSAYIDYTMYLLLMAMLFIFIAGMLVGKATDPKPAVTDVHAQVSPTRVYGRFGALRWLH